ncbi:hypothetical protein ABIB51_004515 [Arthrobacter sp. UYCu712]
MAKRHARVHHQLVAVYTETPSGRSGGSIENSKTRRDRRRCRIGNGTRDARAAAVTGANGYFSCPVGQVVWVRVTQEFSTQVKFYSGTALRYTSGYTNSAVNNYGTRTVNWRVETTGNLQTVSDYCSANYNLVTPPSPPSE